MKVSQLYIARKEAGETQVDAAKLLHMHKDTYAKKEKGQQDFTIPEAITLAKHYGTTLDALFWEG